MGIATVEDAIIAEAKAALTFGGGLKVRAVVAAPGDWDAEMLKRKLLAMVPCVLVVFAGGPNDALGGNTAGIDAHWRVIVATGHASGDAARRRGDSQEIGAYEIIERLIPRLDGFTVPDEGTLDLVELENLYSGEIDKQGLAIYGLTFTHTMAFPVSADAALITPFVTFNDKFDLAPRALYLNLAGGAGNYASTPDSAAIGFAGDRSVAVRVALNDWTPAAEQILAAQWGVAGQNAWKLSVLPAGQLRFSYSTNGANAFNRDSTVATGFQDGTPHWVKASVDVDDGGGNHVVTFWKSDDYDVETGAGTWTQIGANVVTAGAIAIFNSNAALGCGADSAGASSCIGKIFRARLTNGIDGVLAAEFNADEATPNTVSFKSLSTGETWTLNGNAVIATDYQAEDTVTLPQS